jgi:hypothetical protein
VNVPTPEPPFVNCRSHDDCTAGMNGRCLETRVGFECTYDECFDDADCSTVCQCEGGFAGDHNICSSTGNCLTDADCGPGNWCSPSLSDCGMYTGPAGWFCHTQEDECIDDSDCGNGWPWYCRYEQAVGRWTCSDSHCAG